MQQSEGVEAHILREEPNYEEGVVFGVCFGSQSLDLAVSILLHPHSGCG